MSTMAKWGTKKWVVNSSKVKALQSPSFAYEQTKDSSSSSSKKKSSRKKELFTISFKTVLHANAGVDIRKEITSWKKKVTKVNYLYLNGKKLGPKLQLRKVSVSDVKLDNLGRMRVATLTFEFKEYDKSTTSVKVKSTKKSSNKTTNTAVKNASTKSISTGSRIKITGSKYADGTTVPSSAKNSTYKVAKMKDGKVYITSLGKWLYKSDVSLV